MPRRALSRHPLIAGVLLAVTALLSVSGRPGVARATPAAQAGGVAVTIVNFAFDPTPLTVAVGTTVTWTNQDTAPHTATSGEPGAADAGSVFKTAQLGKGESASATMSRVGTFAYFCEVHPRMRASITVTGDAASQAAGAVAAPAAASQPAGGPMASPPPPAGTTVIARGLDNPRGFTWGADGLLYVAESGTPPAGFVPAGRDDPSAKPVGAMTGRVSRINRDGTRTTIADNLPSTTDIDGSVFGVTSVAFVGSNLYVLISAGPVHAHPEFASGVFRVGQGGAITRIADTDAFNLANPPAFIPEDEEISNPYDMVALGGKLYATDGNRSVVWEIDPASGAIRYLADLSVGHPVLTGIAAGPDGALYVTNLTAAPFATGSAKVWRITTGGQVSVVATGFSAATGLAVGPDGGMYVGEFAGTIPMPPFLVPPGRVVRAGTGGSVSVVTPAMFFPTILRWGPDGLYSTYFGVGAPGDGAIIRLATPATAAQTGPRSLPNTGDGSCADDCE